MQGSSKSHNINLGVSSNFSSDFLLKIIDEYENLNSSASIRVYVDSREEILKKLNNGVISLAILEDGSGIEKDNSVAFFQDELLIISSEEDEFEGKTILDSDDLSEKKFVLGDLDEYSKKLFLNYLRDKNIPIDLKFMCQNKDMVLNIVKNSDAISLGSNSFFKGEDIDMYKVKDLEIKRTFFIVYNKDQFLKNDLKNFIRFIDERFNINNGN
nr:substrate-binding domain-containing protein [Peptoniphilus ovalis]